MFGKTRFLPLFLGATAALSLFAFCSCGRAPRLEPSPEPPPFDGREAYFLASAATDFGPRPPGSKGSALQLKWILGEANAARADKVYFHDFAEDTPEGRIKFRNLIVEIKGADERFVVVGAHHDTKKLASFPDFVGANDGGSGVGLAIAMMKSIRLSKSVPPHSVKFVFFDGEECFLEYSKTDGLYGSRRLSEKWAASGLLEKCDAMILLDMVGDADLKIRFPTGSDKTLVDLAFQAADKFGVREYFSMADGDMLDDHRPFQDKGVPSIDFIDFDYGPSNRYWHTSADTKDKLAGESFTIVGRVALQVLWNVPFR